MTTKKPAEYVNNKTLYTEMLKYRNSVREAEAAGSPKPRIPDYIGECILMISTRLCNKPNFIGYSYRDEMIADGIENCIMYGVDKFDPDKFTNPFAYFTQIIKWAFVRRIQKEKKQQYIKNKNMQHVVLNQQLADNSYVETSKDYDQFISEFERGIQTKKAKAAKARGANNTIDCFVESDNDNDN